MNNSKSVALQSALDKWQNFAPCLGANVTVYDSNQGYWNSASGFSRLDPSRKLESDELFYIYSITKTFTAIVIMQLAEKGLIVLDDAARRYLPHLTLPDGVTVRRLLNHTSGVPSYTDLIQYQTAVRKSPSDPWSLEQVMGLTLTGELDFAPGEKWHYSNTGYMLLLLVIEAVTGKSFSQCVNDFIVTRIGLKNTYVAQGIDSGKVTGGYCRSLNDEDEIENVTPVYHPGWCKTGLIVSTSMEVTKLYEGLFAGRLVDSRSLDQMTHPTPIMQSAGPHFKKPGYGLGLMIDPESEYGGSYGHGGDGPGFNTWSVYHPDFYGRPVAVTVLCNTTMGGHPFYLVKDLLRALRKTWETSD